MASLGKFVALLFFCYMLKNAAAAAFSDDYIYSDEDIKPACDNSNCKLPNCSCFGDQPSIPLEHRPQFIMLTFDDAITVANIETYRKIAKQGRFKKNVRMTFFVCHEYNDYTLTNELYKEGHEIAVHTISHESNTDLWRTGSESRWKQETVGMRAMLTKFAGLPDKELAGHRAPFLQTAGDTTFNVLKNEGFLYDSSMPSRSFMDPPFWPYTLDHGYSQDCQIQPCPSEDFAGLWEIPMIQYVRESKEGEFFCSMVDACTPQPVTPQDTKDFLMKNFRRHYRSNKAPFPVFLHEAWLRNENRLEGFLQFFEEVLQYDNVFAVPIRDVVEYIRKPTTYTAFSQRQQAAAQLCKKKETCSYTEPLRIMKSCTTCPKYYPWVGTPMGKIPPKDFPN
ncbi:nodB homology domain-containing protein [Caerostris darwini]|uniref:NodB homology domain-containing protein n=1 Tax=Caerostris darwini TaxID=1538125 RepID=A0AAV4UWQ4_9ARAC|nr:nodB homology domain-containing protein [Caerostris darwini]